MRMYVPHLQLKRSLGREREKMNNTIRKVDELGRIVLSKEARETLRISSGDNVKMIIIDGKVIIKKENKE